MKKTRVSYKLRKNSKKMLVGYVHQILSENLTIPVIMNYQLTDIFGKIVKTFTPLEAEKMLSDGMIMIAQDLSKQ